MRGGRDLTIDKSRSRLRGRFLPRRASKSKFHTQDGYKNENLYASFS